MAEKIVLVDFAGTLVKREVIEEANELRSKILEQALPTAELHGRPEALYKVNREFVKNLTGIGDDDKIKYRENDLDFLELSGVDVQNQISTNLFQIGMFMSAKKHGSSMIPKGFVDQLVRIQKLGFKLAIVSGVRTDIISGMLKIAKLDLEFDYIYGQPPILGMKNQEVDIKHLLEIGSIDFVIGDKLSDLERVSGAKTIFVKWGHPSGGEQEFADYSISSPEELKDIIR